MASKPRPNTRDGFRYHWGEDDVALCKVYIDTFGSIPDQNKKYHLNSPFASFLRRKIIPTAVKLCESDRAPQLKLSDDGLRVTGEKGYSMVRANHGINRGKFYYEVYIDHMPENTATRIGWGQYYANLQAPLGYDHYGYSWRSRFGTKFHQARGKTYDKSGGYRQGDTIGCMIDLPCPIDNDEIPNYYLPQSIKTSSIICNYNKKRDVSKICLEELDKPPQQREMKMLPESKISFYKNGKLVGVAFEDLFDGFYYPTISLYKSCTVTANFGPKFKFPPEEHNPDSKNHLNYQPVSNLVEISIIDHCLSDIIFVVSKEVDADDPNYVEFIKKVYQDTKSIKNE